MNGAAEKLMVENVDEVEKTVVQYTPERRIQRPLFGQAVVSLLVYMAAFCCGLTGGYSGVLLPQLRANQSDLPTDDNMASWIVSIYTGSTSAGCLMSGVAMNLAGRRTTVLVALLCMATGWFLIAFANSHTLMLIGRAVDGFGRGFSVPAFTFHLEEMADPRLRGSLSACILLAYSVGIMIISVLGTTLKWRMAAGLGAGISIFTLIGYCFLPESPVWLIRNNRIQKARDVYKWLWKGKHPHQVEQDVQELARRMAEENGGRKTNETVCLKSQIKEFLKPQYLKPFFIIHIFNMFQIICGTNLFIFYASDMILALNKENNLNVDFTLVFTSGVRVAFLIVSCFVLVWFGRRSMCISSGAGSGIAALSIAVATTMNFFHNWFIFTMLVIYVAFNTYGFFSLPPSMVGELLPSRIRSYAGAYVFTMNDIGMFAATKAFPFLMNSAGIQGMFWIFGCSSLICALFLYLLLPETKGRTLVEVEKYFMQSNILWMSRNKIKKERSKCLSEG